VMASAKAARREDGWAKKKRQFSEEDLAKFTAKRAEVWVRDISKAKEAYETHQGPKAAVRYEELRADTLGTMKRIYSELGIPVGEEELARVVEKHAWENIPEEEKGQGKFYRKATPGGWQEDLTPEQAETIEEITAPLLDELYPGWTSVRSGSS
jgi:sulfotransferase family protein